MNFNFNDVRSKSKITASNQTLQTAITEEEKTVRAAIAANENIQTRGLDLKLQEAAKEREGRMAQKQLEREEKMKQIEADREAKMAQIDADREISLRDLDLTAVKKVEIEKDKIDATKEVHLMRHKENMEKIVATKEMYSTDVDSKIQAYSMDHKERMETLKIKGKLAEKVLDKRGSRNFSLSGSTFRAPRLKFTTSNPLSLGLQENSSSVMGNQLSLTGPEDGSNVTGQPIVLRHDAEEEDEDSNSNDFDISVDEKIYTLEADLEEKTMLHKENMAKLNKKSEQEMAFELQMAELQNKRAEIEKF